MRASEEAWTYEKYIFESNERDQVDIIDGLKNEVSTYIELASTQNEVSTYIESTNT